MNLAERQSDMRQRVEAARGVKSIFEGEGDDIPKLSVEDFTCPYCQHNKTKMNRRSGLLRPCRSCARVANRIKTAKYNITLHDFSRMLREQEYRCAICNMAFTFETQRNSPCIDHCHELEHVRGLLCGGCNTGLGLFGEDEESLQNAVKYLILNRIKRKWWSSKISAVN